MFSPDRRALAWLVLGAIVLGSLPYVIGLALKPAGYSLVGISPVAAGDASVYYSYIEQGRQGHILMHDVFTGEPYAATLWQPLWFVIGQLANIAHLTTPWAYALARVAATPVLVGAIWWLGGWLWTDRRRRVLATSLVILGSGFGSFLAAWWPLWLDRFRFGSIDQWVSEAFVSLTLMGSVHFILVTAGIIFTLGSIERSTEERSWRRMPWAAAAAFGVVTVHPFHAATWMMIAGTMIVVRWIRQRQLPTDYVLRWLVILIAIAPMLLFYALQIKFDPLFYARAVQNGNFSPSVLRTILGLGLFFPLGLWGAWKLVRRNDRWTWVAVWAAMTFLAMYLPVSFQRRLSQGLIIPWALLSIEPIMVIWNIGRRWPKILRVGLAAAFVGIVSWSSLGVITTFTRAYNGQLRGQPGHTYFLSPDQQAGIHFIASSTDPYEILAASLHDSNIIAGLTAHHVLVGHEVETINYSQKIIDLNQLFSGPTDDARAHIIERYHVCYLFEGPQERAIGPGFHPESWPSLTAVWTSPTVTIYRTTQCQN